MFARRVTEHGSGFGRVRWVVERTFAWLHHLKRLLVRYDRRAEIYEAFLALGCCLVCFQEASAVIRFEFLDGATLRSRHRDRNARRRIGRAEDARLRLRGWRGDDHDELERIPGDADVMRFIGPSAEREALTR